MAAQERDTGIDILKGFLVLGMILGHAISLWHVSFPGKDYVQLILDLVAFSGFMFCFGYVTQLSYFGRDFVSYKRIFGTIYRPLIAFYILAVFFEIANQKQLLGWQDYLNILLLQQLPSFTEFLPAFSLTLLVSRALAKPLRWLVQSRLRYLVASFILLATTGRRSALAWSR